MTSTSAYVSPSAHRTVRTASADSNYGCFPRRTIGINRHKNIGTSTKDRQDSSFAIEVANRHTNLTKPIQTKCIGLERLLELFVPVCSTSRVNNISSTEHHLQTSRQAECFDSTLISRLRHYVYEHQTDSDTYLLPSTQAYNVQVHKSTDVSPFISALTQTPSGPATFVPKRGGIASDDELVSPVYRMLELIWRAIDLRRKVEKCKVCTAVVQEKP